MKSLTEINRFFHFLLLILGIFPHQPHTAVPTVHLLAGGGLLSVLLVRNYCTIADTNKIITKSFIFAVWLVV